MDDDYRALRHVRKYIGRACSATLHETQSLVRIIDKLTAERDHLRVQEAARDIRVDEAYKNKINKLEELRDREVEAYIELENRHDELKAEALQLWEALEPFDQADFRLVTGGMCQGGESIIYGKSKAVLKLKHFTGAHEALTESPRTEAITKVLEAAQRIRSIYTRIHTGNELDEALVKLCLAAKEAGI